MWGRPDESGAGLIRTWDATPVFLENLTTFCGDLPLFVDDTRRARSGDDVARVIYNHASGQARGRGSVTGVRGITSSRGVLLMTGETPATAMSNQGGTRARVLSLWGSPFGAADRTAGDTARRVTRLLSEHHGHLGPRLVGWLVGEPNAAAWVRQEYELALAATLQRAGDDPVAGRLAQSVAVLVVCRRVAETWLGLPPPEVDPFDAAWTSMRAGAADADRASAALLDVVAWAAGQQDRLYPGVADEDARKFPPAGGWIGARRGGDAWETLALLPPTVRAFLKTEQYDVEATLRLWGERGWLQRDGKHRGSHVWVGQQRVRCLVIRREAVQAAEGAVPGEDAVSPPGAP